MGIEGVESGSVDADTLLPVPEGERPRGVCKSTELLQFAPDRFEDLPGWLAVLSHSQFDAVWVAALAEAMVREGLTHRLSILRIVTLARERARGNYTYTPPPPVTPLGPTRTPSAGGDAGETGGKRAARFAWKRALLAAMPNVGDSCVVSHHVGSSYFIAAAWLRTLPHLFELRREPWRGPHGFRHVAVRIAPGTPGDPDETPTPKAG